MDFWTFLVFLHVVAMAFFLGGQIMLAFNVVPALRSSASPELIKGVAQRFGIGSLIALGVLVFTGLLLGSHFEMWDRGTFQLKMLFVVLTVTSVFVHMARPSSHYLMGVTFLLTLITVYLGIDLTH